MVNPDTLIAITEEHEELMARSETLYDAVQHVRAVANKSRLPGADLTEAIDKIHEIASRAKTQCDDLLNAGREKGQEIYDEETMDWLKAAGSFYHLTAEGKRRYVAARKRASMQGALTLRQHGTALLTLEGESPTSKAITRELLDNREENQRNG